MTRCHWIFYVFRLSPLLFHWIFVVFSFLVSINSLLLSNQCCIEFSTAWSNWVRSGLSTNLTCNGQAQKKKKKNLKEMVRSLGPRDPTYPICSLPLNSKMGAVWVQCPVVLDPLRWWHMSIFGHVSQFDWVQCTRSTGPNLVASKISLLSLTGYTFFIILFFSFSLNTAHTHTPLTHSSTGTLHTTIFFIFSGKGHQ